ncbi:MULTISPECIES: hypothetical protein [unclassified Kitasatospora]|uniref:hypothetical protein n=1 Tax=unclassified Kitasatospora TaxID=2633591 RepID=UPI0024738344|nr:hypothetical protein [Kitasatospora sp. MAP12-44]
MTLFIAWIGLVALFDFRGARKRFIHPEKTYEEFVDERPSRKIFLMLFGTFFLVGGTLGGFGLILVLIEQAIGWLNS